MKGTGQAYGESWYWDKQYTDEAAGPFEWYQKYPSLKPLLNFYVPHNHRVLIFGCGNFDIVFVETFSEGMVDDGYEDVVNVDISSMVIEAMQKKYSDRPQLKYMKMDTRDMSCFEGGSFDGVVDKGTLDSILCGQSSQQNAAKMLSEVGRVLKDKGVYILITYGTPVFRLPLLRNSCLWSIKLHVIDKQLSEGNSRQRKWELTSLIPLDGDGKSVEAMLGENPDVHYIYVCIKDNR